jgi:hypothetical protein
MTIIVTFSRYLRALNQSRLTWYVAGAFIITVILIMSGCSHSEPRKQASRNDLIDQHVYHTSMSKLRSEALVDSIMNDPDIEISAIQKSPTEVALNPDDELDDLSSAYDNENRFMVERKGLTYVGTRVAGAKASDDMFHLEIFENVNGKRVRQPELEWDFLRRNDPEAAARIEKAI